MAERARFPRLCLGYETESRESEAETERRFARWANRASLRKTNQTSLPEDRGGIFRYVIYTHTYMESGEDR